LKKTVRAKREKQWRDDRSGRYIRALTKNVFQTFSRWRPKVKECFVMTIYRSPMEKILEQQEENTVITSPKEPTKTFFRKIAYVYSCWKDKLQRIFRGGHGEDRTP
jgi:hypothetical protein